MLSPGTRAARSAIAAIALGALLVLTGCASAPSVAGQGTPEPDPARPVPAVQPTAEPVDFLPMAPESRYAADCADLVPASVIATAFASDDVAPASPERHDISPTLFAARHLGGLDCWWRNAEPEQIGNTEGGSYLNPDYRSLHVKVLPDPEDRFNRYATMGYQQDAASSAFGEGSGTGCFGDTGFCTANIKSRGSWLEVYIVGLGLEASASDADADAKAKPLLSAIVDNVPTEAGASFTAGTVNCAVTLPVDDVLVGLGVPDSGVVRGPEGGGYGLWRASTEYTGAETCAAGDETLGGRWAYAQTLPEGAWVFRAGEAERSVRNGSEPIQIQGTTVRDSYITCAVGQGPQCFVDMAVGDDWVQVGLSKLEDQVIGQDREDVLVLAAHVLDNLAD
jgi:hypothetical protein